MNNHFKRATCHLAPEDIRTSDLPPFENFALPPIVNLLYQDIVTQQKSRGHDVAGGLVFGGMFYDVHIGKRPKDIDMYVAIPDLLKNIEDRMAQGRSSYREMEECDEDIASYFGYDFPIHLHQIDMSPVKVDLFGSYVVAQAIYEKNGDTGLFDIIIGKEPVALQDLLPHFHAPVMAVGATLGDDTTYAFHKDYVECATNKILSCDNPSRVMLEKAQTKGWTVMSPTAFQQRQVERIYKEGMARVAELGNPKLDA